PIHPLAAIIEIKAQNRKGQRLLNISGLFEHSVRTLVPHSPSLSPRAGQVGVGQTPNETALQALAAVRHTVGFHKPRPALIPHLTLNRNVTPQQRAWLSGTKSPQRLALLSRQHPIQRRRTDLAY